jgi:hypothetical protein
MTRKQRAGRLVGAWVGLTAGWAICAQDDTALDRLVAAATRYVNAKDPDYATWKRRLEETIRQKQEDGKLSESAAQEQYATDYLHAKRVILIKGPAPDSDGRQIDAKHILDVARHIKYMGERKISVRNWETYKREVETWGDWLTAQSAGKT